MIYESTVCIVLPLLECDVCLASFLFFFFLSQSGLVPCNLYTVCITTVFACFAKKKQKKPPPQNFGFFLLASKAKCAIFIEFYRI